MTTSHDDRPVPLDDEALDAIGTVKWLPTTPEWTADGLPRPVDDLVQIRQVLRMAIFKPAGFDDWETAGACLYVSQAVERWFGPPLVRGCFRDANDGHVTHFWNVLPDGRILDVTADQFDLCPLFVGHDSRYLEGCDCEGQW